MEIEFWQQRWHDNLTGFHLDQVNTYLTEYWPTLNLQSSAIILVPLCGKSLDMVWLASQKYKVLGVECSEKAIDEFFAQHNIQQTVEPFKCFSRHQGGSYELLLGDFFKLDKNMLSEVRGVYDRASLVALPEKMRKEYVDLLVNNLPPSVRILLVSVEYNQSIMSGPPFSVTDEEVQALYSNDFTVNLLKQQDVIKSQSRFRDKGLDYMIERVYEIFR